MIKGNDFVLGLEEVEVNQKCLYSSSVIFFAGARIYHNDEGHTKKSKRCFEILWQRDKKNLEVGQSLDLQSIGCLALLLGLTTEPQDLV
jgi:hypothetical protein